MALKRKAMLIIGWCMVLAVWLLSLLPLTVSPTNLNNEDKIGHLLAYFVMTYWFLHIARKQRLVLGAFFLMGSVIEVLQAFTSYRFFEWADMLANSVGVLMAFIMYCLIKIRLNFLVSK